MDLLGVRLEPILNPQLALLPALNIPRWFYLFNLWLYKIKSNILRYQRYPLGNGQTIQFDQTTKASMVWGDRRVDHQLFCPQEMNTLPPLVLPSILHASYWESKDVSAFILRQFVRPEQSAFFSRSILSSTINESQPEFQIPSTSWNKRRTRFKVLFHIWSMKIRSTIMSNFSKKRSPISLQTIAPTMWSSLRALTRS
jgi:hypothetical protein